MSDTSTVTASESPSSFSALPASAWEEPIADGTSGAGSQPAETPQTGAAPEITPASRDSAGPEPTPRAGEEGDRQQSGPIPYDRHKAILEDERKQRTDLEAKWQRVAWAEELANAGHGADAIREALKLYDGIDGNPIEFLGRFYELLSQHPQHQTAARSWAGRILGTRGAAEPEADPEPTPTYYEGTDPATGQRIRVIADSDGYRQKWQEWFARQQAAQVDQKIAPLLQDKEARERQARELQAANQIYGEEFKRTQDEIAGLRKYEHFSANEKGVLQLVKDSGYKLSPTAAFVQLLNEKILPTLSQTERTKTLTELRTQANASTVSPKAAATATPGPAPNRFRDLPKGAWDD